MRRHPKAVVRTRARAGRTAWTRRQAVLPLRTRVAGAMVLAGAAGAALWRRARPFPVRVEGASMWPTLTPGDQLIVTRVPPHGPRRGQVVVARRSGEVEIVKRVAWLPGERGASPEGYWLSGDNPDASTDSRTVGSLPAEALVGVARACYWPPRSWRLL